MKNLLLLSLTTIALFGANNEPEYEKLTKSEVKSIIKYDEPQIHFGLKYVSIIDLDTNRTCSKTFKFFYAQQDPDDKYDEEDFKREDMGLPPLKHIDPAYSCADKYLEKEEPVTPKKKKLSKKYKRVSKKDLPRFMKIVERCEGIKNHLKSHINVNDNKFAYIVRLIENHGKYYGGSKNSKAWGGYMFLPKTVREIVHSRKIHGLTLWNWKTKKHQDQMFHYYLKQNRRCTRGKFKHNPITDYLTWQMGRGGFTHLYGVLYKGKELIKVKVKSLHKNMTNKDIALSQHYQYAKLMLLLDKYHLKIRKTSLRKDEKIGFREFSRILNASKCPHRLKYFIKIKQTKVRIWEKHFDKIILKYLKR